MKKIFISLGLAAISFLIAVGSFFANDVSSYHSWMQTNGPRMMERFHQDMDDDRGPHHDRRDDKRGPGHKDCDGDWDHNREQRNEAGQNGRPGNNAQAAPAPAAPAPAAPAAPVAPAAPNNTAGTGSTSAPAAN